MLDILRDFIHTTATPELATSLQNAHGLFERIGLENYEPGFEEALMLNDNSDPVDTLTAVVELTNDLQRQILTRHDVGLIEHEVPTSMLSVFIQGLLDIQNYSDSHQLLQTTLLDLPEEEIFAEVMALVSQHSADELLPYVESVGTFLITRLRELGQQPTLLSAHTDDESKLVLIEKLQKFCTFINDFALETTDLLAAGMDVGYDFIVYAREIGREMETWPAAKAAKELIAMALISEDGNANPRAIIQSQIEHFIASVDQITRIDMEISKLLLEWNHHDQA